MLKKILMLSLLTCGLNVICADRAASAASSDDEQQDLEVGQINNEGSKNLVASMVGGFNDKLMTESQVTQMLEQYKLEVTRLLADKMSKHEWNEALNSLDKVSEKFHKAINENVDSKVADALSTEIQKFNAQIAHSIQQQIVKYLGTIGKLEAELQAQAVRLAALERARRNNDEDQQGCCFPFLKCCKKRQRAGNNVAL